MKELFASGSYGLVGLLFFFAFFISVLVWLFWPGSKKKFEKHGHIPFKDEGAEAAERNDKRDTKSDSEKG